MVSFRNPSMFNELVHTISVGQKQEADGIVLTLTEFALYRDGFATRIQSDGSIAHIWFSATDNRGNAYALDTFSGASIEAATGREFQSVYYFVPVLAADAETVQIEGRDLGPVINRAENDQINILLDSLPNPWTFLIALRRDDL
jgi:hypothetical protein